MKSGLLTYTTYNIGDDIQSLAARQFLPESFTFLDRDRLTEYRSAEDVFLIANGWFSHCPENFPPPETIHALWVSTHLTGEQMCSPDFVGHLKNKEPIGCRDLATVNLLSRYGIEAYFSACLTLTLRPTIPRLTRSGVLSVDVPRAMMGRIPRGVQQSARYLTHFLGLSPLTAQQRLQHAAKLVEQYASAELVVTGRLHCALPCAALGTPCVFITDQPGDIRFSGLQPFLITPDQADLCSWAPSPPDVSHLADALRRLVAESVASHGSTPLTAAIEQVKKAAAQYMT